MGRIRQQSPSLDTFQMRSTEIPWFRVKNVSQEKIPARSFVSIASTDEEESPGLSGTIRGTIRQDSSNAVTVVNGREYLPILKPDADAVATPGRIAVTYERTILSGYYGYAALHGPVPVLLSQSPGDYAATCGPKADEFEAFFEGTGFQVLGRHTLGSSREFLLISRLGGGGTLSYPARTATGGISARVGNTPGEGDVERLRINPDTGDLETIDIVVAKSWVGAERDEGVFGHITYDPDGEPWWHSEDCPGSAGGGGLNPVVP